jgi:hypothetical protein
MTMTPRPLEPPHATKVANLLRNTMATPGVRAIPYSLSAGQAKDLVSAGLVGASTCLPHDLVGETCDGRGDNS